MTRTEHLPGHLEVLYARTQIETRLDDLAPELDAWAREAHQATGQPLLAVCVLRGGVFFFSDLLLRMSESVEPGFCRAASYAREANQVQHAGIHLDLQGLAMRGRDVVFVDNICDSGRTLEACVASASSAGARATRTVVLVHRLGTKAPHRPTLAAFSFSGVEWLAGYGMRDRGAWMNLPCVCRVAPDA